MRHLTLAELATIGMLIREAEDTIAQMCTVLSPDEPAVRDMKATRDWLRGVRDAGCIVVRGAETGPAGAT